jgi:hypothetical protein
VAVGLWNILCIQRTRLSSADCISSGRHPRTSGRCLILGDVFSPWMVVGTFLIAGGAVLIAIFGIVPEPTHSLEALLALFRRPTFIVYFSLLGAFVVVSLAIVSLLS